MASESSFDVVSKVDRQEVDNALNQAIKEIAQRYDFKNVGASIAWSGEAIVMTANSAERVMAILDVFQTKLIKRGISLKSLDTGDARAEAVRQGVPARGHHQGGPEQRGREEDRQARPRRGAQGRQGAGHRATRCGCSAKSRDDLQAVIALLKGADLDVALQFVNYR